MFFPFLALADTSHFSPLFTGMPYSQKTRAYVKAAYGSRRQYRKMHAGRRAPGSRISSRGVGGATQSIGRMSAPAPEVKTLDLPLSTALNPAGTAVIGNQWNFLNRTSVSNVPNTQTDLFSQIGQGASPQGRNGRKVKVVGVVFRASVAAGGAPFTIDFILDKQPNGACPTQQTIYNTNERISLPNASFNQRFKWLKRCEHTSMTDTEEVTVNCEFKPNCYVTFDASNGNITDIETNNLLCLFTTPAASASVSGYVRVLYVDA